MTAREQLDIAMAKAITAADDLETMGKQDRALGLAVGVDLSVNVALLFTVDDAALRNCAELVDAAVAGALS